MVSVPPSESWHPVIFGGAESVTVYGLPAGTLPLAENDVHFTVIFTLLIVPANVMSVPDLSFPVTFVPAGNELGRAAEAIGTATNVAIPTPSAAISTFL